MRTADQSDIQVVAACLVRVQRMLLARGYRYAAGDARTWPLSPVLLVSRTGKILLVASLLPDARLALAAVSECARFMGKGLLTERGIILVGPNPVDSPEVEPFFQTIKRPMVYLDAVGTGYRDRTSSPLLGLAVPLMTDGKLGACLEPSTDASEGPDCRALLEKTGADARDVRGYLTDVQRVASGRKPYATYAILAVCTGLFALQAVLGVNVLNPRAGDLVAWGASFGPLIKLGQWWRLVTNVFLHIGLIHLALNMYATRLLGRSLERFQGTWRTLVLFFFGGLAGSVVSLWWTPLAISAGASSGLFGIIGAMAALYARFWREMPAPMRKGIRSWLITVLAINAVFLLVPAIDGAAHVGGLIGGFLMALALLRTPRADARPGPWALGAAGVLLAATLALAAWATHRVPMDMPGQPTSNAAETASRQVERPAGTLDAAQPPGGDAVAGRIMCPVPDKRSGWSRTPRPPRPRGRAARASGGPRCTSRPARWSGSPGRGPRPARDGPAPPGSARRPP